MSSPQKIAIFGAGMTGLVAGRELAKRGHDVHIYEASDHIGGLASTFRDEEGFVYDNGPRFIFSTLADKIGIADICEPVRYLEHIHVGGKNYLFPFGVMKNPLFSLSAGLGMLTRVLKRKPDNLGNFLSTYYGRYFSKTVLAPLIEKWSGVPAKDMSIDFASRLLPTSISYILYQVLRKIRGGITEDFYKKGRYIVYPKGSNSKIFETLARGLNIHLNTPLKKIHHDGHRAVSAEFLDTTISADSYISTIPIQDLVCACGNMEAMKPLTNLEYRGIFILFIKLNKEKVLDGLWTWYPEVKFPFYRISEFKNALDGLTPPGKTLIAVEFACHDNEDWWSLPAEQIYARIKKDLDELYGIKREDIHGFDLKQSRYAYPILKKSTEEIQRTMTHQTPLKNLFIAGRIGMFQYRMLEGCYESAIECIQFMEGEQNVTAIERDEYGRPKVIHE